MSALMLPGFDDTNQWELDNNLGGQEDGSPSLNAAVQNPAVDEDTASEAPQACPAARDELIIIDSMALRIDVTHTYWFSNRLTETLTIPENWLDGVSRPDRMQAMKFCPPGASDQACDALLQKMLHVYGAVRDGWYKFFQEQMVKVAKKCGWDEVSKFGDITKKYISEDSFEHHNIAFEIFHGYWARYFGWKSEACKIICNSANIELTRTEGCRNSFVMKQGSHLKDDLARRPRKAAKKVNQRYLKVRMSGLGRDVNKTIFRKEMVCSAHLALSFTIDVSYTRPPRNADEYWAGMERLARETAEYQRKYREFGNATSRPGPPAAGDIEEDGLIDDGLPVSDVDNLQAYLRAQNGVFVIHNRTGMSGEYGPVEVAVERGTGDDDQKWYLREQSGTRCFEFKDVIDRRVMGYYRFPGYDASKNYTKRLGDKDDDHYVSDSDGTTVTLALTSERANDAKLLPSSSQTNTPARSTPARSTAEDVRRKRRTPERATHDVTPGRNNLSSSGKAVAASPKTLQRMGSSEKKGSGTQVQQQAGSRAKGRAKSSGGGGERSQHQRRKLKRVPRSGRKTLHRQGGGSGHLLLRRIVRRRRRVCIQKLQSP